MPARELQVCITDLHSQLLVSTHDMLQRVDRGELEDVALLDLKVKVTDLHIHYQLRVSHDACLVQIMWFQLKSVITYRADKVEFTHRQTDGQTQATTIPLRPEMARGKTKTINISNEYCKQVLRPAKH